MFAVRLLLRQSNVTIRSKSYTDCVIRFAGTSAATNSSKIDDSVKSGSNNVSSSKSSSTRSIYRNMYKWKSEIELAKLLASNVVYSNNNGLFAIIKPYGLGIYRSSAELSSLKARHQNFQFELSRHTFDEAKFCISDVLDYLAQLLQVQSLHIVKSLHRDWSGLLLLSTDPKSADHYAKAVQRAKAAMVTPFKFYCITNGIIPRDCSKTNYRTGDNNSKTAIDEDFITERCGIRLLEIDEFGSVKEPVYVSPAKMSNKLRKYGMIRERPEGMVKSVLARYRTLAINRKLAVSLVELETTVTKWSFIQCFLAYKAAFVLGDTLFSNRVKHIMGQPITIKPVKSVNQLEMARNIDQRFEPLSEEVRRALGVRSNAEIPLMIYNSGVVLPGFCKSLSKHHQKNKKSDDDNNNQQQSTNSLNSNDLIITANSLDNIPRHFRATLDSLGLNVFENQSQQQQQQHQQQEEENAN